MDSKEFLQQAVIYEVNVRQFGEDGGFKTITDHLPRLSELGVDILWLMPIHPISLLERKGSLGSPYSVADYYGINPEYGTEEDFRKLVSEAHSRNMMVILDWVANHTGWDHPWITENPDWYTQVDGEIIYPMGTDWIDVADLNFDNQEMRKAMIDAMKYWVEEFDIDGYRADVAHSVPVDFWNEASSELHKIKDVFMLAEDGGNMELLESAFDTNYAWGLKDLFNRIGARDANAADFRRVMESTAIFYSGGPYQMVFTDNHDENSWSGTVFERLRENAKGAALLSFTVPGMPLIYSGQEIAIDRRLEFFEKDPIVWPAKSEWGKSEWEIFYRQLVELRTENPALWTAGAGGDLVSLHEEESDVIVFSRSFEGNDVVIAVNLDSKPASQKFALGTLAGTYQEFFSGQEIQFDAGASVELGGHEFQVFFRNTPE
ncbi:MAG: alpha-amylase family glycosyl hydrolase [bacterium]